MNNSKNSHKTIATTSLISATISVVLLTSPLSANTEKPNKEQCAGVVKAGLNDCGTTEHVCAGMNTEDGYDSDWLWLPTGTCDKVLGSHILKVEKTAQTKKENKP